MYEFLEAQTCRVLGAGRGAPEAARHGRRSRRSGYLDSLGYEVPDATLDQIFRYPDKVKKALEEGNRKAAALGR